MGCHSLLQGIFLSQGLNPDLLQCRRPGLDPWVGKVPWGREWPPTSAFLPGESHGQRSLAGYRPWGHKESDANRAYTATNAQCNFPIETSSPTANLGKYFHFKFYHLGFVTKSESVSCSVVSDSSETPRSVACQAPLSMEFSRQEYWSGMSFPFPGDLPDPGIKPGCPALQAGSLV